MGHLDAWHASNQNPRHPHDQRLADRTGELIDAALGPERGLQLRADGAQLDAAAATAIARTLLAGVQ